MFVVSWCWCKLEKLKSIERVAGSLAAFQLLRFTCALRPWEFDAWGRTVILVDALALTTWLCPDLVSDNVLVRFSFLLRACPPLSIVVRCYKSSAYWKVEGSQFGPIQSWVSPLHLSQTQTLWMLVNSEASCHPVHEWIFVLAVGIPYANHGTCGTKSNSSAWQF